MKIDIRFSILILLLVVSLWYLFSPILFKTNGVKIISIDKNAECGDIRLGGLITEMEGKRVESKQDFDKIVNLIVAGNHVTMVVNGGPGSCTALEDGELGIKVKDAALEVLKFGTELVGGEKIILSGEPELSQGDVSYISDILKRRLKTAGWQDSKISVDGRKILIYAPVSSEIEPLLINGKVEAVIEQELKLTDNVGKVKIDGNSHDILWDGSKVIVKDVEYEIDEFFDIEGVKFKAVNATNKSIIIDALVFENSDVERVDGSLGFIKYEMQSRQYQFNIPIEISEAAGERFSKITKGLISLYGFGETGGLLNGRLIYFLGGEEITQLSIPSNMAGTSIKTISIVGSEDTMKDSVYNKMLIEIGLEGEIEKELFISGVEGVSGSLNWFVWVAQVILVSNIIVLVVVGSVIYKNLKIGAIGSALLGLELIYIFGVAALSQSILPSGWVIDASSLSGVCVFSIISVVQTALLSERFLKKRFMKRYSQLTISVFVVGGLMLFTPLNRFGLALIIGGLFGVLLTKPVYRDFLTRFR